MDYDIIVIGAGSAGLTVAIGGSQIGAKVLLVEKEKIGGDCTHHGCVPSKTLIKALRIMKSIKEGENYGISAKTEFSIQDTLKKVTSVVDSIYEHETPEVIKQYGIDVELGSCSFVSKESISVNGKEFSARHIVIATGSRAFIPQIKGLESIKYMTNKEIFNPSSYSSLAVLGAGPIGCELGQAFSNLGVAVTIINNRDSVLSREDSKASELVQKELEKDGVNLLLGYDVERIEERNGKKILYLVKKSDLSKKTLEVDELLIATGRTPNIEGLNLEGAGIKSNSRGISVDKYGRTSNKRVYAAGDVNGSMQFTHLANSHAKSILTKVIFKIPATLEQEVIPRVTYTTPEVASIGIKEDEKEESDLVLFKKYSQVDRAITESNTRGFFKIIVSKKGYIKGATLVGEGSGELIGEIALAMKNKIKITQLADTIHPYPTYGYGLRNCADQFRGQSFTENKKKWVKRIFRLRG